MANGPFEWKGKCYWITYDDSSLNPIIAYMSVDYGRTQPLTPIFPSFDTNAEFQPTLYWDGTSRYVYMAWLDTFAAPGPGNTHPLLTGTFDLETEQFALNDPGVAIASGNLNQYFCIPMSGGDLVLIWDEETSATMNAVVSSGGTWSSTISLASQVLLGAMPLPGNTIGIFGADSLGVNPATIRYGTFDGSTYTAKASTTVSNYILSFYPYPVIYDPNTDTAAISVPDNASDEGSADNLNVYTVSPSDGSGGAIAATLIDSDPSDDHGWEICWIAANRTSTKFYAMVNIGSPGDDPTANFQLWLYSSTALTGPWGAHTLFYDQNIPNSVPPGFSGSEYRPLIYPFFLRVLNDERLAVTAAFGDVDEDDSLVAMIQTANFGCRYFCS